MTPKQLYLNKKILVEVLEDACSRQDIDTCFSKCLYASLLDIGMNEDDAFELSIELSEYNYYSEEMLIEKLIRTSPNSLDFILS